MGEIGFELVVVALGDVGVCWDGGGRDGSGGRSVAVRGYAVASVGRVGVGQGQEAAVDLWFLVQWSVGHVCWCTTVVYGCAGHVHT